MRLRILLQVGAAASLLAAAPAVAVRQPTASLSGGEMLALADRAARAGDAALAERMLRLLAHDPDVAVRSEARFRLGRGLAVRNRLSEAALLFRAVLDEQPNAQPVRLELAQMLDRLGDETGARRVLREVQAGGLPPEVARFVDRWSAALRARKPIGSSIEIAIAPDSNINRATRSDSLGTVIGDFTLDREARQRSGTGLAVRGQAYARVPMVAGVKLLARLDGSADRYRQSRFSSENLAVSAGPEITLGADRLTGQLRRDWHRFGGRLYAQSVGVSFDYLHPLGRRSQLRAGAAADRTDNRRNRLEDGADASLEMSFERALSSRAGVIATLSAQRQRRRDPGYSTRAAQASVTAYREFGPMTLIGSLAYGRLRADDRLLLYSKRRDDLLARASLGAQFRQLTIGGFAPVVRISAERNRSSITLYDFRRVRTEFGITHAF